MREVRWLLRDCLTTAMLAALLGITSGGCSRSSAPSTDGEGATISDPDSSRTVGLSPESSSAVPIDTNPAAAQEPDQGPTSASGTNGTLEPTVAPGRSTGPATPVPGAPQEPSYSLDIMHGLVARENWNWEVDLALARRRPTALLVACNDFDNLKPLQRPIVDALELSQRLAECGYDVKLLIGLRPTDAYDNHPRIQEILAGLKQINDQVIGRNEYEAKDPGVAPLRTVDEPEVFFDNRSFWQKYERWLSNTFGRRVLVESPGESAEGRARYESVRPPFGFVYVGGHGDEGKSGVRVLMPLGNDPSRVAIASPDFGEQERPPDVSSRELGRVASLKYHAPLWMIADLCRERITTAQPSLERTAASLAPTSTTTVLRARTIAFPSQTTDGITRFVKYVESLRENAVVGELLTARESHLEGRFATVMHPDIQGRPIEDGLGIAPRVATLSRVSVPMEGEPFFEPVERNNERPTIVHSFTIHQVYERARSLLIEKAPNMNPERHTGPIGLDMIVLSSLRGHSYERVDNHLFSGGLTVNADYTGFTVNRDEKGEVPIDRIEVRRDQEDYKDDFKAVLNLKEPVTVPGEGFKLVLQVRATSPVPNDSVSFIVGVYAEPAIENGMPRQLTTHFSPYDYGQSQFFKSPLPCDGRPVFLEVPLDGDIAGASITSFEVQANPQRPHSWSKGTQLSISCAALIPINQNPESISSQTRVQVAPVRLPDLLASWWSDTKLARDGTGVGLKREVSIDRPSLKLNFQHAEGAQETIDYAGCTGKLYPRLFVDQDRHQLHFKVADAVGASPKAKLGIVVYDGDRMLCAWYGTLAEASGDDGISIPLNSSGVADEVSVVARGVESITIKELRFVSRL